MIKTACPGNIRGSVTAPPSKSQTQRAIAAAMLSKGLSIIRNPSTCEDSNAALKIAQRLGATVTTDDNGISITGIKTESDHQILNCEESGLALRMFAPLATLYTERVTFIGTGTLLKRPVSMITDALQQMGVETESNNEYLPVTLKGHIKGGSYNIDGSSGSQLLTGLLMALPLVESDSEIYVANLTSKPYIALTLDLLRQFDISVENHDFKRFVVPGNQKYKPGVFTVEGDWSGSAFLLVAGAIAGKVEVDNLSMESIQADIAILNALKNAGADISVKDNRIIVRNSRLEAFNFDATESPDLFPPLAALASYCEGTSSITGINRLEHKESNRAVTIMQVLEQLGITSWVKDNNLMIKGSEAHGAAVSSGNDHRIAMMATVIALRSKGNVIISEAEAVAKSYPEFYNDMKKLGMFIR